MLAHHMHCIAYQWPWWPRLHLSGTRMENWCVRPTPSCLGPCGPNERSPNTHCGASLVLVQRCGACVDTLLMWQPLRQQLCSCTAVNSVVWQPHVQELCSCIGWVADEMDQWLEGKLLLTADKNYPQAVGLELCWHTLIRPRWQQVSLLLSFDWSGFLINVSEVSNICREESTSEFNL